MMKRPILLTISIVVSLVLALWLIIVSPGIASKDERALLELAVRHFQYQPAACIAIFSSSSLRGYGYIWVNEAYSQVDEAVEAARAKAKGRQRSLLTSSLSNVTFKGVVGGAWDRIGCMQSVKIGTPKFSGNFAFVDYFVGREIYSAEGTIAFRRTSKGWEGVGSLETGLSFEQSVASAACRVRRPITAPPNRRRWPRPPGWARLSSRSGYLKSLRSIESPTAFRPASLPWR